MSAAERRDRLKEVWEQARTCTRCPQLAETRQTVVFGSGNADADLMFVGEAPGANEDKQGRPFVGQAGKLLEKLLGEIGLSRGDVFIANVLKCLRYNAMVQLGDGSWERIGRLVGTGYAGTVMSVAGDGRLEPRRVTGWHATPLGGRRVFRLSYRSAKRAGAGKVNVELTGDHEVLTERGYVAASELCSGDRVATGQGLSDVARDVVCGSLLGDASIRAASASLTFAHSASQAGYARFKARLTAELSTVLEERQMAAAVGASKLDDVVLVRSRAHRSLRVLRDEFYRPRKVVPGWIDGALNPRMLAIWFMDDGHMRIRPGRQPLAEIATVGFTDDDRQVLLRGLARLGLTAKASRSRLYFDVAASRGLATLIAPFVPPSMRYKLHPEVEAAVPFDAERLRPGRPIVLYDEVEVEDVTDRPRADRTFFCLDVEENHNFVTSGGVVHNCRPPGNRDPLPGEIENCSDYLRAQVRLIEPRVVCSLGNFSTKLLRDDSTGITRLHGRPEIRRIFGGRAVRLYPLYHPAAALYTPSMLDVLREDFARLPALLAEPPPPDAAPEVDPEGAADPAVAAAPPLETPPAEHAVESTLGEDGDAIAPPAPPPQLGLF